ncbi:hypothetical protein O1611_g3472 [Lasiodiplodia mahajangana]|uniref:Uncharacterized protein n=1 Tax=Lasiodiplodia mahajangana TaxID=1108764 RepID=A0ACC2JRT9_9PEZI|nr:hypothetical protein O1611_g3472 [Lasiodiplodia mahajangana]
MPEYRKLCTIAPLPAAYRQQQKQRRNRYTDEEWARQKDNILRLYRENSAQQVLEILRRDFNFPIGLRILRDKLREWGAPNKNLSHDDMTFVQKKRRQLRIEGKQTQFYHCSQPLAIERLERFDQRFSKPTKPDSSPLPETPDAITYDTPKPIPQVTPDTIQPEYCQAQPPESPEAGIMLVFTYIRAREPDSRNITHKHQMGKLAMQSSGISLEFRDQERLLLEAYQTGVEMRKRILLPEKGQALLPTNSLTLERGIHTTCFWATYPTDRTFDDDMKHTMIHYVQHAKFLQSTLRLLLLDMDNWTERWFPIKEEEGRELKRIIEGEMGSNTAYYPALTFLDLYVRISTPAPNTPILAKVSLGTDTQKVPVCSICETDVFSIQLFGTHQAISITIPLTKAPDPVHPPLMGDISTSFLKGGWEAAVAQSAGFQLLAPCQKLTSFEEQYEPCLERYEIRCDRGEWDPLVSSEYLEAFQAFPVEREHICCNRCCLTSPQTKEKDEKEFNAYPDHVDKFAMSPDHGGTWDPSGMLGHGGNERVNRT